MVRAVIDRLRLPRLSGCSRFEKPRGAHPSDRVEGVNLLRFMDAQTLDPRHVTDDLSRYPLLAALRERRSRRFGLGMKIPSGPLV